MRRRLSFVSSAGIGCVLRKISLAFGLTLVTGAAAAQESEAFKEEIVTVSVPAKRGEATVVDRDEHPRPDATLEKLLKLKSAFVTDGTVTAGNSSGINDGASALAVVSGEELAKSGRTPLARIVTTAVAGVDPSCMGLGPIPATKKALARAGLTIDDLDLVELNEAFASQSIACIKELELDPAKVNIYGGAIALGHALGSSGSRILTTLVHALDRTGGRYGLATMCIGVGQGIAMIVERKG